MERLNEAEPGDSIFFVVSDYRFGLGNPSKVHVREHKVLEIKPSYLVYQDEHGRESTAALKAGIWVRR